MIVFLMFFWCSFDFCSTYCDVQYKRGQGIFNKLKFLGFFNNFEANCIWRLIRQLGLKCYWLMRNYFLHFLSKILILPFYWSRANVLFLTLFTMRYFPNNYHVSFCGPSFESCVKHSFFEKDFLLREFLHFKVF